MKKVAIIGVGLIGGSLGMSLKRHKPGKYKIFGLGRDKSKLQRAVKLRAIDEYYLDWNEGVKDADIVVICTPVHLISKAVEKIYKHLKKGAIITDAGSVKDIVLEQIRKIIPAKRNDIFFVPAHPMAGLEKTGVESARHDLYKNATVVITPDGSSKKVADVVEMWRDTGAEVIYMKSSAHDEVVAVTSHLPHILAFLLSSAAKAKNDKFPDTIRVIAGSFKDMTRIADSNPADWASICSANSETLLPAIESYLKELQSVKKALKSQDKLENIFSAAKSARQTLLNIK